MTVWGRDDLRTRLKRREIAPVYVLFGPETHLRNVAARTIANLAFPEGSFRDFNEDEFSLNHSENLPAALAAANQLPMMAERRLVRITDVRIYASGNRDTIKEDHEKLLADYLGNPSPLSVVIFIADEFDKRRKMSKLLIDKAFAVEFLKLKEAELVAWARKEFRDSGFDIDEKTLHLLIGLVGDDLLRLGNEIRKVTTAALPDRVVPFDLVDQLVGNSRAISNFDLTDQIFDGNRTRSFSTLKKILDDGGEPLMVLGLVANNFRRLFTVKEMMARGIDRNEVAKILGLRYGLQEDFLATARRADRRRLAAILARIAETDLAIKTSRGGSGSAGARMQMELLLAEITAEDGGRK